jgi:Flp pilus assembly protein TadG
MTEVVKGMNSDLQRRREGGQALVVFVLALVAIIGMTGLVLDGGSVFAQRRAQQNVADLAAMAAVIAYANTPGDQSAKDFAARSRAQAVAAENGYADGVDQVDVDVISTLSANSARYLVRVHRPHRNNFAGLLGQPVWNVSANAAAVTGIPNAAIGAMPLIFNTQAFYENYTSKSKAPGQEFSEPPPGNGDIPLDGTTFNWTVYCTGGGSDTCNADTKTVGALIDQYGDLKTVAVGDAINPLNAGSHTDLYGNKNCTDCGMQQWIGYEFPVAIVDDDGDLVGFATFHLVGVEGGSRKVLVGYFTSPINPIGLTVVGDGGANPFAGYVVKLVD